MDSPDLPDVTKLLGLRRGSAPNASYTIQSNDLTSWQEMTTQSADASGFATYPETNLSTPRRFYRIKEAP